MASLSSISSMILSSTSSMTVVEQVYPLQRFAAAQHTCREFTAALCALNLRISFTSASFGRAYDYDYDRRTALKGGAKTVKGGERR